MVQASACRALVRLLTAPAFMSLSDSFVQEQCGILCIHIFEEITVNFEHGQYSPPLLPKTQPHYLGTVGSNL